MKTKPLYKRQQKARPTKVTKEIYRLFVAPFIRWQEANAIFRDFIHSLELFFNIHNRIIYLAKVTTPFTLPGIYISGGNRSRTLGPRALSTKTTLWVLEDFKSNTVNIQIEDDEDHVFELTMKQYESIKNNLEAIE
jgi:hypothetical protein